MPGCDLVFLGFGVFSVGSGVWLGIDFVVCVGP